ncbi:MAG: hypothetical protein NTZ68_01505 [Candidatus Dependentiae bacterium]|nr:hypothetical protein [Candidatus Dependentiae bacterium]
MKKSKTNMKKLVFTALAVMASSSVTHSAPSSTTASTRAVASSMVVQSKRGKAVKAPTISKYDLLKQKHHELKENKRQLRHTKHHNNHHKRQLHSLERHNKGQTAQALKHRSIIQTLEAKMKKFELYIENLKKDIKNLV